MLFFMHTMLYVFARLFSEHFYRAVRISGCFMASMIVCVFLVVLPLMSSIRQKVCFKSYTLLSYDMKILHRNDIYIFYYNLRNSMWYEFSDVCS